jgi:hypothetical protein
MSKKHMPGESIDRRDRRIGSSVVLDGLLTTPGPYDRRAAAAPGMRVANPQEAAVEQRGGREVRMPRAWSAKDERQYEHIKDGNRARGMGARRAQEIAARTVNKQRRKEGRTPNARTQGTGNPNVALAERTKAELYNLARERGIQHRSQMSKDELIDALHRR